MNNIPAHKNINNPPGQVVNHPKCDAASQGGCYCDGSCLSPEKAHDPSGMGMQPRNLDQERLLKDYIIRKQESNSFFKD